jgi:hypothetical protein
MGKVAQDGQHAQKGQGCGREKSWISLLWVSIREEDALLQAAAASIE